LNSKQFLVSRNDTPPPPHPPPPPPPPPPSPPPPPPTQPPPPTPPPTPPHNPPPPPPPPPTPPPPHPPHPDFFCPSLFLFFFFIGKLILFATSSLLVKDGEIGGTCPPRHYGFALVVISPAILFFASTPCSLLPCNPLFKNVLPNVPTLWMLSPLSHQKPF